MHIVGRDAQPSKVVRRTLVVDMTISPGTVLRDGVDDGDVKSSQG